MTKVCSYCKTVRERSFFAKNNRASDKLCSKCKVCQKAYSDAHKEQKRLNGVEYRAANAEAVKARKRAYVLANPEWKRDSNRQWAAENKQKARNSSLKFRANNPDKGKAAGRAWRTANPEKASAGTKAWRASNRGLSNAITARYRACKIRATPSWANAKKIDEFYVTAEALGMWTGEWHHVDHIVPLRGRTVAGLHVEHNLQILTQSENCKKHASWWPQMPERLLHG